MQLTAVEVGFGRFQAYNVPWVGLHTGRYANPELNARTTQFAVDVVQSKWREFGQFAFVGEGFVNSSPALARKLFEFHIHTLARASGARILFEKLDWNTRWAVALLESPSVVELARDRSLHHSSIFLGPDPTTHLDAWRNTPPSVTQLVEFGAVVADDDQDRDLLVLSLFCSAEKVPHIEALFTPFIDPTGLPAPQVGFGGNY